MSNYKYLNNQYQVVPNGFYNTGAICWFNSLLQSLLSCTSLSQDLLQMQQPNNIFQQRYIAALRAQIAAGNGPVGHISADLLGALMQHMRAIGSNVPLGSAQECAHEGFVYVLDALEPSNEVFRNQYEYILECADCGHKSSTRSDLYFVPIYPNDNINNNESFQNHILHHVSAVNDYKCDHCGRVASRQRSEALKQLRECVVIMYQKFYQKEVRYFPAAIEFPALPRGTKLHYEQVAQIEHYGGMHGGHYAAMVRRGDSWYMANDTQISAVVPGPTETTFMVFYHLVSKN